MRSQKRRILDWLDREVFLSAVVDFQVILLDGVSTALRKSRMDAEAFVTGHLNRFWNYLLAKIDDDRRRGIRPIFEVADSESRKLKWVPKTLLSSSKTRNQRLGLRLEARPYILRKIDTATAREYEALGCVIGQLAGAKRYRLTPRGNEAGVDFFAVLDMPGRCHLFSGSTGPLRIVGQSKMHSRPVEPGPVREFITSVDMVRNRNPVVEPHVPPWFRSAKGPIVGWMIGHRGTASGADGLARDHGIVTSDSLDLAEIAAMARDLSESEGPESRANTLMTLVRQALDSFEE